MVRFVFGLLRNPVISLAIAKGRKKYSILGNVEISYDISGGGLLKPSECSHMGIGQIVI